MSTTDEDDLRLLLHSPALTIEPAPGLADTVRGRARRTTRRRRTTGALLTVAVVVGGVALGPAVVDGIEGLTSTEDQVAGITRDPRFPDATSDVVVMRTLSGAQLLTWWERGEWCTVTSRVTRARTCVGPIDPTAPGIPRHLGEGSPSLTVDNREVIAGVLGTGIRRVQVHLVDGRYFEAVIVEGRGFVRPVWSAVVEGPSAAVDYIGGYDDLGREIVVVGG